MIRMFPLLSLVVSLYLPSVVLAQPAPPISALVGQTAKLCGVTSSFDVTVSAADAQTALLGNTIDGTWVVLIADVMNTGDRPDIARGLLNLKDDQGRVFPQYSGELVAPFMVDLP